MHRLKTTCYDNKEGTVDMNCAHSGIYYTTEELHDHTITENICLEVTENIGSHKGQCVYSRTLEYLQ